MNQKGFNTYVAPDGYVFDYREPRFNTIKELDGTETKKESHLYAKYLTLGKFDSLDNYSIVQDPKFKSEG